MFVAYRVAVLVSSGLGECAAEFELACVRWLAFDFARDPRSRPSRPEYQCHPFRCIESAREPHKRPGTPVVWPGESPPVGGFRCRADGLGLALHRLGCDLQTGQQFQLFTPPLETRFAAHHCHHAPDSGRIGYARHVQFAVARALTLMAMRAKVVAPLELYWAKCRQQLLGPRIDKEGHVQAARRTAQYVEDVLNTLGI